MSSSLFKYAFLAAAASSAFAKIYYQETFDSKWQDRWVQSKHKGDYGKFQLSHGKFFGDAEKDLGLQTSQDARFYAISSEFPSFSNKDKDFVVQFSVKHEQNIDCGGGYIKVLPKFELSEFHGETPYNVMFGPDICGPTKKVHVIINYNGKNWLIKKEIKPETDEFTHVYTLVISPNQTYKVLIDQKEVASGKIEEDWDVLGSKKIKDPEAKKPEDWDDRAKIEDPNDEKPEDWDKEPEFISDPDAKKPEDWDDDMDGEWEPPQVPNPEYKGTWRPKLIDNPDYQGVWIHPEIDNPDYKYDPEVYLFEDSSAVGFDLWQVKSGTIFDNIILTDSIEEAKKFYEDTTKSTIDAEKKAKEKIDEEARKKAEEAAKAAKKDDEEDDDDEDDDEEDDDEDDEEEDSKPKKDEL